MQLSGVAMSPGTARGQAVLVEDANAIGSDFEIDQKEILVCDRLIGELMKSLDCAGIISAQGDLTSHAAVFARSEGIPAVGNCPESLREISNGQIVEIDGDNGQIDITEETKSH